MSELFRFDVSPELKAKMRQQGIDQFSDVKTAYMESDGEISVIRVDEEKSAPAKAHRQAGVK